MSNFSFTVEDLRRMTSAQIAAFASYTEDNNDDLQVTEYEHNKGLHIIRKGNIEAGYISRVDDTDTYRLLVDDDATCIFTGSFEDCYQYALTY